MAAATLLSRLDDCPPGMEVAQLEASDGETYTCKRLSKVTHATASGNEDIDAHLNVVTDGTGTVTINYAAQTDKKITLVCYGKL